MKVSLIIPAYNEEETIGEVIRETSEIMELYGLKYEILVVNDCSTDNTKQAALFTNKAIVFTNNTNRGKGYCLRRALKHARGDIIITLDADGEHKPKEIPELLNALFEGNDIVAGSRFLNNKADITSRINRLGNFFFNITITTLTGRRVTDSQTGFRAIKREIVEAFNLQSDGFEIESEFTIKSLRNGFRFKEVPITVERRKHNKSKIRIISDGTKILSTIIHSALLEPEYNDQSYN